MRIIATDKHQIDRQFLAIELQGFLWSPGGPLPLFADECWDDTDEPMVNEACPHCGQYHDQHYNSTGALDLTMSNVYWTLHHCTGCDAVWFDRHVYGGQSCLPASRLSTPTRS
jgi:hypothetical protein